ncbi:MAG TPA: hypothetical protein VK817_24170 [Trebonia sp.]|jgi:hypothetical protein|nr:hypothetical protein [Trebonia sp.]
MNLDTVALDRVRRVADAVLYEGYILYPYRASAAKNHSRWQFGVLAPPAYAAADPSETTSAQSECVFERTGPGPLNVAVLVRFLQVQRRSASATQGAAVPAQERGPRTWDEALEHEIPVAADGERLLGAGAVTEFSVPGGEEYAEYAGARVMRRRERLTGTVSVRATGLPGPWQAARLRVRVENSSASEPPPVRRDQALPTALVAVHMIITVSGGRFLSMTDPPEWAAADVAACDNVGLWPALAGPDGGRQVMLASPIILPDHPELAPESPGELYDGTEIDEILTLRTLALSDEEKQEARATDPRAAALIERVEALDGPAMDLLHGTVRLRRGLPPEPADHEAAVPDHDVVVDHDAVPWWDPAADSSVSPDTDAVMVNGHRIARGSRVTLRPGTRRADAQDMFVAGRPAIVEAVLLDVDDHPYLAVTLADDPDPELRSAHGRFLYFAPDEVEPSD